VLITASRLARVLFTPRRVFEEQRERPTWFVPWLVIALALVVIGLINLPYADRMIALELESRPDAATQPDWVPQMARLVTIAGQPLFVLAAALLSAAVMWPVLKIAGHAARFRALLCAATFANAATVVQAALIALAFRLRGAPAEAIHNARDVRVSVSADLLLPPAAVAPFVRAVLAGIGPLEIWAVVVMAVGVKTLEKPRHGAWAAAIAAYVVLLMLAGLTA
jgi:hypothetical protein